MHNRFIVVILILTVIIVSANFSYDEKYGEEKSSGYSPNSFRLKEGNSLDLYNFSYDTKTELLSEFNMLVASPDVKEIYIVLSDRVISYYRNWTYFTGYEDDEREIIYDAYSDDINLDGIADIAIVTQDHNIHVVDGASGEIIWRAYPTFVEPYTRIKVLDVMPQLGKEILIWTSSSNKIYVWSAMGFPLLEIQIDDAASILDISAGDLNKSVDGNELAVFYYDLNERYRARCMNLMDGEVLFDVSVLVNLTGNPYTYTYMIIGNVSRNEGNEIILGGVPLNEIGAAYIEVLNSTGENPTEWNNTMNISGSENWLKIEIVDYDTDGENEVVMFSKNFICVANNSTDLKIWRTQGTAEMFDGTTSYSEETLAYELLVLWRPSDNMNGLYMGYINKSMAYIQLDIEFLVGVYDGLFSIMKNTSITIALNYGSYVLVYEGTKIISEKKIVIPINILESEEHNMFVTWSYSGFTVYNSNMEKIFQITYSAPETIQYIKIGNYHPSTGIEIGVMLYVPEEYVFICTYNLDGNKIFEYDNVDMLNNNLTIKNIGPVLPNTNNMSIIASSTINNTHYLGILDIASKVVYITSELPLEANMIKYSIIDGKYVWVICEKYEQRIYIVDSSGRIIGIKEFEDIMIQDIDTHDIDLDGSDEIMLYVCNIPWDVFEYIVCSSHLVKMFVISNLRSKPRVYDILPNTSGKEILSVRYIGGNYYFYVYSHNGSQILSISFGRQERDGIYLWNNSKIENMSLILVPNMNGKELSLVAISEDEKGIKTKIKTMNVEDYAFTLHGISTSPNGRRIGSCLAITDTNSIAILDIYISFDGEDPDLSISSEDIEYISVLGEYITSRKNISLTVNASDDSEITTLIYNISCYDRENRIILKEQHIKNISTRTLGEVIEIEIKEEVFNMTIEVAVFDPVGKNTSKKITIYIDNYPPQISTLFPESINISTDKIEIKAYIWDDLWISKAYIEIGKTKIPMTPTTDTTSPGRTIIYSAEISPELIKDSPTQAKIVAIDFADKKSEVLFTIYKEKPEEISETPTYTWTFMWILMGAVIGIMFMILLPYIISGIKKAKKKISEYKERRGEHA